MSAPRVLLSPRGMVVVQAGPNMWAMITDRAGRVDQLVYLDPVEVAGWREYAAPDETASPC